MGRLTNAAISRIDLSRASQIQLKHLADTCDAATFGVNQQDVLDESYRKAGKLDNVNFATKFVIEGSGLMDVACSELLEGHESNKQVRAELYKLNVYSEPKYAFVYIYLLSLKSRRRGLLQITQGYSS